jgi:protein-tyrosine phosphatase
VIDLHSHVLPGLDDGAADLDESLEMCRAAARDGIEVLAATPHVRFDYPTSSDAMRSAVAELRRAMGSILRLVPGGELDLAELDRPAEELKAFGLAGNASYLLVETPYVGWPLDIADKLFLLRSAGITPVLAHPERNPEVQADPELLMPLVDLGSLVQLTAASLDGRLGPRTRSAARTLLDRRLAHLVASDAHAPEIRAIGLSDAASAVGDPDLAQWLTVGVPGAIVEGRPLPPRPERQRRAFWRLGR